MKAMISQPLAGKTDEEIAAARERAIAALEAQGFEVINTLWKTEWYSRENMVKRGVVQIPLGEQQPRETDAHAVCDDRRGVDVLAELAVGRAVLAERIAEKTVLLRVLADTVLQFPVLP